jgi:hypothetical protein
MNEKELQNQKITLNKEERLVYMKLIGIGPKTLADNSNVVSAVPAKVDGFFISGEQKTLREALHKLVDMACDALEATHNG